MLLLKNAVEEPVPVKKEVPKRSASQKGGKMLLAGLRDGSQQNFLRDRVTLSSVRRVVLSFLGFCQLSGYIVFCTVPIRGAKPPL